MGTYMDMAVAVFAVVSGILSKLLDVTSSGMGMGLDGAVNCS